MENLDRFEPAHENYIISLNKIEDVEESLIYFESAEILGTRRKYITVTNNRSNVDGLVKKLHQHGFYKSIVILDSDNNLKFYKIDHENSKCGEINGIEEITCTEHDLETLFKPRMKEHYLGCELKIAFTQVPPWLFIENNEMQGILVDFLKLIGESEQWKLTFLPHKPVYDEDISENYNFESLHDDFEDGIGGIQTESGSYSRISIYLK
ncbi:hypothetical protein HHI36_013754 [Cryptolaemus montrouzieri]|uniref:DUF38 domain-containing protein n=1 Tax=Cryptolaemus montrouzieri TaxID=559131 RepID=A0ABD2NI55_9CUCU